MTVHKLAFSGWMASGKDTVAAEVMRRLGEDSPVRLSYADPIRDETDRICRIIREGRDVEQAARELGCERGQLEAVIEALRDDIHSGAVLDSRSRTDSMRRALQIWGTDVRRKQNENYWVEASLARARSRIAAGESVYYTDMRFPNEVDALKSEGFHTIRIQVERSTQAARLRDRDGLRHHAESLLHPSETALDGHQGFHQVVSNDGALEDCVSEVVRSYQTWRAEA